MSAGRVVVVGSFNVDLVVVAPRLPGPGETVSGSDVARHHGGKGGSQAVAAARLGAEVAFVGAVGAVGARRPVRPGVPPRPGTRAGRSSGRTALARSARPGGHSLGPALRRITAREAARPRLSARTTRQRDGRPGPPGTTAVRGRGVDIAP